MTSEPNHVSEEYTVASLLRDRLAGERTREENQRLTDAMGYSSYAMIERFVSGGAKVPIDRAPLIAAVLGIDPVRFLRAVLVQYAPRNTYRVIFDRLVTENESVLIRRIRELTNNTDPEFEEEFEVCFRPDEQAGR